jgi:hypothetical protein
MSRPLARLAALLATLVALAALLWGTTARAEGDGRDGAGAMPPRDVSVVVQPSAARLPPLPGDFQRIDDGWLVLEFPGSVRERVVPLAREAETFRARLSADLGQPVLEHALVRVARSPEQMAELAPEGAPPPEYAAGVAYPSVHLALLALQAPETWEAPDLVELLGHELTHLALSDAVDGHHVPRWYDEGLAVYESGELWWARDKTLFDATLGKRLLPLADLDRGFPPSGYDVNIAYAESADVVRFLMRDDDRVRFGSLVQRVRGGAAFDRALEDAYGTDVRKLEYQWREEVTHRFGLAPMLAGGGFVWVLISALAVVAWVKRRRRARAKLEQWAREEAEMDALVAAAREREERAREIPVEEEMPAGSIPGIPVVEHEGRWYTLH